MHKLMSAVMRVGGHLMSRLRLRYGTPTLIDYVRQERHEPSGPPLYEPRWAGGDAVGLDGGAEENTPSGVRNKIFDQVLFSEEELEEFGYSFANCELKNCYFNGISKEITFDSCVLYECKFNVPYSPKATNRVNYLTSSDLQELNVFFENSELQRVVFSSTKFQKARFNICNLRGTIFWHPIEFHDVGFIHVLGLETCTDLAKVHVNRQNVDQINRDLTSLELRLIEKYLSWESLRTIGRLPLFSVSLGALVLLPATFFFVAAYNEQVYRLKDLSQGDLIMPLVSRLQPLMLPSLSFWLLVSTLVLGLAATLFTLCCPSRVKEFSSERWMHELGQPALHYLPLSWSKPSIRVLVALGYGIGGFGTAAILCIKLWNAGAFVLKNTTFPAWAW